MITLAQFEEGLKEVPATTSWYLSDLGEARGKQELFTHQTPQKLKVLRQHALIDGNGRVSRLLLLLQLYHLGFEVGRYISLERLIEQNKERYYETLEQSSQGWHEGKHDPWHYINFVLFIIKEAYKEFEERAKKIKEPKGAKTELIESAIHSLREGFTVSDLEKACPSVSRDMIRRVLHNLKKTKRVKALGRGPGAIWRQKG